MWRPTRRIFLQAAGLAAVAPFSGPPPSSAAPAGLPDAPAWRHGISLYGDLKYPPGFRHFDYVNATAPKTGLVRQGAFGTYDNFNPVVSGWKGNLAAGIDLIYETLMASSLDEVASQYGMIAEAANYPADFSHVTFRLDARARWHDGTPISPEDVIFSFETLKTNNPRLAGYYQHVVRAERTAEREVTFTFDAPGMRELPQIVGQLLVLPRHWWTAKEAAGKVRDVTETTLEPPLGSGAYRIDSFEAGRSVVYRRVADYWAKDLPVNIGSANFDELRFDYFRDATVEFEAFKAGYLDWRTENVAVNWATGYGFPAVLEKRVVREGFPIRNAGIMQAFAFNLRRAKFRDPRLRRAFNFAFDFEGLNRQIFYGAYKRISSYFEGTALASSGLPQGRELEILQSVAGEVPPELFIEAYRNPVGGGDARDRANLLHATRLLADAGFVVKDLALVDAATGEQLTVEFLLGEPSLERFVLIYAASLKRLGMNVVVRDVDTVQYVNRLRDWDFDIIVTSWGESLTPGNEQRDYWGSRAADVRGSRNLIGIKNKAVDALIEHIVFAGTWDELVAATRALDRVLLWNHYVVPQWTLDLDRTARWDRFARPAQMPKYGGAAFPTVWWWDAQRAAGA